MPHADRPRVLIIGAGIAGLSAAMALCGRCAVTIVEKEFQPAYHATGRSSAISELYYGPPMVNALSAASRPFFADPPKEISGEPFGVVGGGVYLAYKGAEAELLAFAEKAQVKIPGCELLDTAGVLEKAPFLDLSEFCGGLCDPTVMFLDVGLITTSLQSHLRRQGVRSVFDQEVLRIERPGGPDRFRVYTREEEFAADFIVNCAGAWADEVAAMAGLPGIGLQSYRRTAVLVDRPPGATSDTIPMIAEIHDAFYFKHEGDKFLLSPADETLSPPMDSCPEDIDVAIAIDRFERMTHVEVRKIHASWSGLRSFAPDRVPVIAASAVEPGFIWFAGLGGYGVQIAPEAAKRVAALIPDRRP